MKPSPAEIEEGIAKVAVLLEKEIAFQEECEKCETELESEMFAGLPEIHIMEKISRYQVANSREPARLRACSRIWRLCVGLQTPSHSTRHPSIHISAAGESRRARLQRSPSGGQPNALIESNHPNYETNSPKSLKCSDFMLHGARESGWSGPECECGSAAQTVEGDECLDEGADPTNPKLQNELS